MTLDDTLRRHLTEAVREGVGIGLQKAIDCLSSAMPNVTTENQTWNTAIAVLEIVKHEYEKQARTAVDTIGDR